MQPSSSSQNNLNYFLIVSNYSLYLGLKKKHFYIRIRKKSTYLHCYILKVAVVEIR